MEKFTEKDTEMYYDNEDEIYLSFWDPKGTLHWGLFEETEDVVDAGRKLTEYMIDEAKISTQSVVLNVGCGDGETDIKIYNDCGCDVVGIDISGVRINNAKSKLSAKNDKKIQFLHATATNLPFSNESFSHVISQSTIYHIHDKDKALSEISRVLKKGGLFIFDDLVKPQDNISKDSKKYVYERLLFDTDFSFDSYKDALSNMGFELLIAREESNNLKKTYQKLIMILQEKIRNKENQLFHDRYKYLIEAYQETVKAVERMDVGWAIYVCKKI